MIGGVQFTRNLPAGESQLWSTTQWPQNVHLVWYVVPLTPDADASQLKWEVKSTPSGTKSVDYEITVTNLANEPVMAEARYVIVNFN